MPLLASIRQRLPSGLKKVFDSTADARDLWSDGNDNQIASTVGGLIRQCLGLLDREQGGQKLLHPREPEPRPLGASSMQLRPVRKSVLL